MQLTPSLAIIQVLVFFVCVGIGYLLSRPLQPPENPTVWLIFIAVVFIIGYLPFLALPVSVFGAPLMLNNLLWGVGIGMVIGLMIKRGRRKA